MLAGSPAVSMLSTFLLPVKTFLTNPETFFLFAVKYRIVLDDFNPVTATIRIRSFEHNVGNRPTGRRRNDHRVGQDRHDVPFDKIGRGQQVIGRAGD